MQLPTHSSSLVPRLPLWMQRISLMPRPLPRKAERGSGVLIDISCHMGRGLRRKECHIYILHPGLEFSDDLRLPHGMVYKSLIRPQSFLEKLRTSCRVSFFCLQFGSKYDRLRHAYIIMRSRIWFELSDQGTLYMHLAYPHPLSEHGTQHWWLHIFPHKRQPMNNAMVAICCGHL